MKKELIIARGIPGCGKSSFAELLTIPYNICTADDYFITDGVYKFNPDKLHIAHRVCQEKCSNLMEQNTERIVVANTSTTLKEFNPYLDLAKQYGYKVYSVIVENRHGNKDIHNVPVETLEAMETRFQIKLK